MKYYFITYQANSRPGSVSIWNQVINESPMNFIKSVQVFEENGRNTYRNFVIINTCEISENEYNEFKVEF